LQAKLNEVKAELQRRMHERILSWQAVLVASRSSKGNGTREFCRAFGTAREENGTPFDLRHFETAGEGESRNQNSSCPTGASYPQRLFWTSELICSESSKKRPHFSEL